MYRISRNVYLFAKEKFVKRLTENSNNMCERSRELDTEEPEYSYDLPDSTSEDEIPELSSITSYSFEPIRKLSRSLSLSSTSNASMDGEKQEQSSRIGNTSWYQCGKCYAVETEGVSLCCQDTNDIPEKFFRGMYFSIVFLM